MQAEISMVGDARDLLKFIQSGKLEEILDLDIRLGEAGVEILTTTSPRNEDGLFSSAVKVKVSK